MCSCPEKATTLQGDKGTIEQPSTTRRDTEGAVFYDEMGAHARAENQDEAEAQDRAGTREVTGVREEAEYITESSQENVEGSALPITVNEELSQSSIDMHRIETEIHELCDDSIRVQEDSTLFKIPQAKRKSKRDIKTGKIKKKSLVNRLKGKVVR